MMGFTLVTEHVNNLNTLFSQLTSLSCIIEPQGRVEILLQILPDLYDQLIISLTGNVLTDYLVFDDVAAAILEEENRHNNREDREMSLALLMMVSLCVVKHRLQMKIERDLQMYGCSIRELDVRHVEGLKKNLLSLGQLDDLGCKVEIQYKIMKIIKGTLVLMKGEKHQKLGHMSEQGMKILVERKLIHVITKEILGVPNQEKSDVFEVFKEYKVRVKLDSGKKIKCLRTDNGGEYTEQMNRTLLERARAMLLKTPMEMWTGKPVNYSDLHIFGSPVYVMYNSQETTKLDLKSRKCVFLGYADGVMGYRLWNPTTHKVVFSRDVVLMEDKIKEIKEGDSTTRETTSIQMENEFQSNVLIPVRIDLFSLLRVVANLDRSKLTTKETITINNISYVETNL
ncbi:gag-pol polyprotein [Tanacetum coccineum]